MSQHSANIGPTWSQNGPQRPPKWSPNRARRRQNGGQSRPRHPENRKKTTTQQRTQEHPTRPPPFYRKCRQHGPNLAPQMEPKSEKKAIAKTIKFWVACEIGFSPILIDFRSQNGAKMATKWDLKSMLTWRSRFVAIPMKNQCKSMHFHVLDGQKIMKKTIKQR